MIVASLFILFLFLPSLGVSLISTYQIKQVRSEMKTKLKKGAPKELIQQISLSKKELAELIWIRPTKEFRLNGKLYDVIEQVKNKKRGVIITCISDTNEDILFVHLDDVVNKEAKKQGITVKLSQLIFPIQAIDETSVIVAELHENHTAIFNYLPPSCDRVIFSLLKPPTV